MECDPSLSKTSFSSLIIIPSLLEKTLLDVQMRTLGGEGSNFGNFTLKLEKLEHAVGSQFIVDPSCMG